MKLCPELSPMFHVARPWAITEQDYLKASYHIISGPSVLQWMGEPQLHDERRERMEEDGTNQVAFADVGQLGTSFKVWAALKSERAVFSPLSPCHLPNPHLWVGPPNASASQLPLWHGSEWNGKVLFLFHHHLSGRLASQSSFIWRGLSGELSHQLQPQASI